MQPIWGLLTSLILANVAAWAWAFVAFHDQPFLLGTALLAWSLGLRHAVDADHIAAIDNVTRKLMQAGRPSVTAGLFFALGHSAVVALVVAGLAVATPLLGGRLEAFKEIGGLIGALASSLFLFAIALVNLVILRSLWRIFRRVQNGGDYVEEDLDAVLAQERLPGAAVPAVVRPDHAAMAHVAARLSVRAGLRHRDGGGAARPRGKPGRARAAALVGPGVSGPVRRRHGAGRHGGRRSDGRAPMAGPS